MRIEKDGISIRPIAGSHSVVFGFDATPEARKGLLGFALGRRAPDKSVSWMRGFKFFEATNPTPEPGERKSTREHPVQDFQWGDYGTEPGRHYDYVVQAVYGTPAALSYGAEIDVPVDTANAEGDVHSVYFNRGAIPSQAFADKFGNVGPTDAEQNDPSNEKVKWLSRGLLEAVLAYIAQAKSADYELRVAAYEFYYAPILEALKSAAATGAKVQICYDAGNARRDGTVVLDDTSAKNVAFIAAHGLDGAANITLHPRRNFSKIPHNKFIVLLKKGAPVQILTGSTNFTPSGFLGQSNVAHIVRDPDLAATYNRYWEKLASDPQTTAFKKFNSEQFTDPMGELTDGTMKAIFSPRAAGFLEWVAERMGAASSSVMFTAAFGVADQLVAKFAEDKDFIRFVLMERADRNAEKQALLESDRDTRIALGTKLNAGAIALRLAGYALDQWFRAEEHFRSRGNIFYIHTKIMLIDALSDDPQIYCGSANFSDSSVTGNDENLLLLRGPGFRRVADIYVSEYMRLFNHLYFRTVAMKLAREKRGDPRKAALLDPTDAWVGRHFRAGSYHCRMRELFA